MSSLPPARVITADTLRLACDHLSALSPRWRALIAHIGECRHETHPQREPYEALMRAVAYQQLTTRAGDAMIRRLLETYSPDGEAFPSARQIAASDTEALRRCGFSARKVETLHAIANGALHGEVPDREQALGMEDEQLIETLCRLKGIGRWTVEMYLIYGLERINIMPLDDLGIRQGLCYLHERATFPPRRELAALSAPCHPYSTVAAWYLWRSPMMPDYAAFKARFNKA